MRYLFATELNPLYAVYLFLLTQAESLDKYEIKSLLRLHLKLNVVCKILCKLNQTFQRKTLVSQEPVKLKKIQL